MIIADATVSQGSTLTVPDACKMALHSADCHRVGISFISLVSLKCLPVSLSPTVSVQMPRCAWVTLFNSLLIYSGHY